jgi:hypothetical protein
MVNRRAGAEPFFSEPLPDAPWPVAARNLLTERERSLYQSLLGLYPDHKIFVQVALSQLIDVDQSHPESKSIRARYKQLVADFVLCRSDLSVIAVIELDDRSHERRDRQAADGRKTKALADAGIRLVRVPAGTLPSKEQLKEIVDADRPPRDRSGILSSKHVVPEETELQLAEIVDIYPSHTPMVGWVDSSAAESRALKLIALKWVLGGTVLFGGWFFWCQFLPFGIQRAFQPMAVRHEPGSLARPKLASTVTSWQIPTTPVVTGPAAGELAEKRGVESQAAALQRQEYRAWAAFYSAPASCEHPIDWNAQVECGNQYMRAKNEFEKQWLAEHASGQTSAATVTLDN